MPDHRTFLLESRMDHAKENGAELYQRSDEHVIAIYPDGTTYDMTTDTVLYGLDSVGLPALGQADLFPLGVIPIEHAKKPLPYDRARTDCPQDATQNSPVDRDAAIRMHFYGDKERGIQNDADDYQFAQNLKTILADLELTLLEKRMRYGNGNFSKRGQLGALIRLEDKLARADNLIEHDMHPTDEPLSDTWKDTAGYAILCMMLESGQITGGRKGVGK